MTLLRFRGSLVCCLEGRKTITFPRLGGLFGQIGHSQT